MRHSIGRICRVLGLAILLAAATNAAGSMPATAPLAITEDIVRFWDAFDRLPDDATVETAAPLIEEHYLQPGSPGLRAFQAVRFESAEGLAAVVLAYRTYYASIRDVTLAAAEDGSLAASIRPIFDRLEEIEPGATTPDVYFIIGHIGSGGIQQEPGLIIGLEMFSRHDGAVIDSLDEWKQLHTRSLSAVPDIVAHELIHHFQADPGKRTLLKQSLIEGAADYVGELLSGAHINARAHAWGKPRWDAVWREFRVGMNETDLGDWMYGEPDGPPPADLGYFVGYEICRRYVDAASDRNAAIREVLHLSHPKRIVRKSGLVTSKPSGAAGTVSAIGD